MAFGLNLTNPITINGPGAKVLIISGNNTSGVFTVHLGVKTIISGLTIANSGSTLGGVAGIVNAGDLTVNNCTFANNSSGGGFSSGGGISNSATLHVNDCTFKDNGALTGGALYNSGGNATITNSTFSGNLAAAGGAIHTTGSTAILNLRNCTFSGNTATSSNGGGILSNGGATNVANTLISANTAVGSGPNLYGAFTSQSYNFIGHNAGSTGFSIAADNAAKHDQVGTVGAGLDAKLDTLKNNGGPTDTMALLIGSPAIDAGSCGSGADAIKTDQRGRKRPFDDTSTANVADGCDMGAFEAGPASRVKPDALIRTSAESAFVGNNIYNLDGTNQTKSITVQPDSTATYLLKIQNDGNVLDAIKVTGTAGGSGWKVQYFDSTTGQNITPAVTGSSGWWIPDLAVGGSRILRLKVTPAATVAGGSIKNVLVTVSSVADGTKTDVVKATTAVASSAAPQ